MPNLSPPNVRDKYMLYNNKLRSGAESAQNLLELKQRMAAIGYEVVLDRGDIQGGSSAPRRVGADAPASCRS